MHELALCDAMLKMVRDISREQALEGVRSITVRVGSLSGVVPRFLTDCWVAVTDGTEYDGVPLRVETEAGRARCLDCGAEFVADVEDLSCPDCGGKKLMPLSGRDMTIQEIEAYRPHMQQAPAPAGACFGRKMPPEADRFRGHPSCTNRNQKSALPTVRGCSSTSRMLLTPVRYMTMRSKPRPKPAWRQLP